jgi:hypothetical protein
VLRNFDVGIGDEQRERNVVYIGGRRKVHAKTIFGGSHLLFIVVVGGRLVEHTHRLTTISAGGGVLLGDNSYGTGACAIVIVIN